MESISQDIHEEIGEEHSFSITTKQFELAIYESQGKVISVWYNDPTGRGLRLGISKKIDLYLGRYGVLSNWELRMKNAWMRYYFNETDKVAMVYGIDKDVIRFNSWNPG